MTDQDYTHISVLIDRSGSMENIANDTIGGFNSFLRDQKAVKGKATLSLATFASDYTLIHDFVDIQEVSELTPQLYRTTGSTALLYATANLINSVGQKLAALPEENRPSRVITCILTDGEENYSHNKGLEYNLTKIKEMIEHQTNKYNWLFVFLGADLNTFRSAQSIGISTTNSMKFVPNSVGVGQMYNSLRSNTIQYRTSSMNAQEIREVGFFNLDKDAAPAIPAIPLPDAPVVIQQDTQTKKF